MKILITGATGYFASELIRQLDQGTGIKIIAVSSNPNRIESQNVIRVSNADLISGNFNIGKVDCIVHTAFCRKSNGKLLVESLNYMREIVNWAIKHNVEGFINLSSQSVYGSEKGDLPDEMGALNPGYLYAMAKCAGELLLEEMAQEKLYFTNIRLASMMGPSNTVPNNVLYKFIEKGISGDSFQVVGGKQMFSFLDVRDAAAAVRLLLKTSPKEWEKAYNLGPERQTNMLDMADLVCKKILEKTGRQVDYEFLPDDTSLNAGMNSTKIYRFLNWTPQYTFDKTTEDTIDFVLSKNRGMYNAENQLYRAGI